MATKTRRRRRAVGASREQWQVVDPDGVEIATRDGKSHSEGAALSLAQNIATHEYAEPVVLTVRLMPLFGQPDEFFRVVREEDGSIITYRM